MEFKEKLPWVFALAITVWMKCKNLPEEILNAFLANLVMCDEVIDVL